MQRPAAGPATESSPARLVLQARAGDRSAFRELYTHFAPMVHALALGIVGASDADDVTQDVFLSAWKGIGELRDAERCGPWLASMARNRARNLVSHARPARAEQQVDLDNVAQPAQHSASPGLTTDALLAHLRELPEAFREVLTLRLVERYSGPEIAALLERPAGSVRVNLFRGMELLRARLRRGNEEL